jgi:hypothetical protein
LIIHRNNKNVLDTAYEDGIAKGEEKRKQLVEIIKREKADKENALKKMQQALAKLAEYEDKFGK